MLMLKNNIIIPGSVKSVMCKKMYMYAIQSVPILRDLKSNENIRESRNRTNSLKHVCNTLSLLP